MRTMNNRILKLGAENGQTMVLGLIAALILLVGIFFLFDIHSIIRVKIKAQTAADAAALTAANWQRHSLNIIGELNLIKASTILVDTVFPGDPDPNKSTDPVKIEKAADILTEMQSRISFVGPMLGFGAAQQAAKNNGMNPVSHYNTVVSQHIELLSDDYYYGEDSSGVGVPQIIPPWDADGNGGYHWRDMSGGGDGVIPYREMIRSVLIGQGGIAAAPNVNFASLPDVTPAWLMDLELYNAIASEYWCYDTLRALVHAPPSGRWWLADIQKNSARFPEECEYSPIYIDYSKADSSDSAGYFTQAGPGEDENLDTQEDNRHLKVAKYDVGLSDTGTSNFPEIRWCIYEDRWDNGPSDNWTSNSPANGQLYLRSVLKPEYCYGGAVAKMTCVAEPGVISSLYNVTSSPKGFENPEKLEQKGSWIKTDPNVTSDNLAKAPITCSALAKPLGCLPGAKTPNSVKMVLPVFTESRLIPVAMQDPTGLYDPFNEEQYRLFEFLKWLVDNDVDIGELSYPFRTVNPIPGCPNNYYLLCLQKLNTPGWRKKGFNPGFIVTYPTQPYDPSDPNSTGAGWLQMASAYAYDATGNPTAILRTNEDTCDTHQGSGGSNPDGPEILH